jgi:hypothetical protein
MTWSGRVRFRDDAIGCRMWAVGPWFGGALRHHSAGSLAHHGDTRARLVCYCPFFDGERAPRHEAGLTALNRAVAPLRATLRIIRAVPRVACG